MKLSKKELEALKYAVLTRRVRAQGRGAVVLQDDGIAFARIATDKGECQLVEFGFIPQIFGEDRAITLQKAIKDHSMHRYHCSTCLSLGQYRLLVLESPIGVPEGELNAAIRWRLKELIDFPLDDVILDVYPVPESGERTNKLINVVVARISEVRKVVNELHSSGANIDVIDIPEMVLRNIIELTPENDQGVVFLYVADFGSRIIVIRQSQVYLSRPMDFGMADIRNALEEERNMVEGEVVGFKVQSLIDRYSLEIQRSLDYYESHFPVPPVSRVMINPLVDFNHAMLEHLAGALRLPVTMLDLNEIIDCPNPMQRSEQENCLLAVGAALRSGAMGTAISVDTQTPQKRAAQA